MESRFFCVEVKHDSTIGPVRAAYLFSKLLTMGIHAATKEIDEEHGYCDCDLYDMVDLTLGQPFEVTKQKKELIKET